MGSGTPQDPAEPAGISHEDLEIEGLAPDDEPDYENDPDPDYDPTEHMTREELDELAREAELAERDYEVALVRDAIRSMSKDAAKSYLAKYGDAVDARIRGCLEQSKQLAAADHPGPALALAATALETTIRFLLLRPLVQGAFLSDRWADLGVHHGAIGVFTMTEMRSCSPYSSQSRFSGAVLRSRTLEDRRRVLPVGGALLGDTTPVLPPLEPL